MDSADLAAFSRLWTVEAQRLTEATVAFEKRMVAEELLTAYKIRDTAEHVSIAIDLRGSRAVTFWVDNLLDQTLTVQVKGNSAPSLVGALNIGSSFTVSPGTSEARTLTPETGGWPPYCYVALTCSTAPTVGVVNVKAFKLPL